MKNAITKAIKSLQCSSSGSTSFVYNNKRQDKTAILNVTFLDSGIPVVDIEGLQGFNPKYIKSKAVSGLMEAISGDLPIAVSGLTVYTRVPANLNEKKVLPADTHFYATESTIVYCGGKRLGQDFNAECINNAYNANCYPDGGTNTYTIYKLS